MRLYILSNDPVTNVTYQLGASGTSVAVSVEEIDSISTIEIPDDVILASSTDSYIYVNVDNVQTSFLFYLLRPLLFLFHLDYPLIL